MGYGDLGCYGNPVIKTPNLDRLAAQGMRLTDCYAGGPVCSPSRAALLTGRTPCRMGIHAHIPWGCPMHLGRQELTVATLLRNSGYATCHVGKWHLNGIFNAPQQPQPWDHGFDYWFSTQNNALPNHFNPDNAENAALLAIQPRAQQAEDRHADRRLEDPGSAQRAGNLTGTEHRPRRHAHLQDGRTGEVRAVQSSP